MADFIVPPKAEEVQVLRFLDSIDGEAEASRKEISKDWEENIRQVRGDQWRIKRSPYFLANIIKNQVRRKIGGLTEVKPQFQVRALKAMLEGSSNVLYNSSKCIFDRTSADDAIYKISMFGMTMGSAFMSEIYDPILDDIDLSFVDPRRVWLDPAITSGTEIDRRAQYVRLDTILPLTEIRMRFPGRGMLVKPDEKVSAYSDAGSRTRLSVIASVLQAMPKVYRPGRAMRSGPIPRAQIREYWIIDPQLDVLGHQMFPNRRHIIRSGNVVLIDETNKYWDGGVPLDMFEWDTDYDSPWGLHEVGDLRRLQESMNRMGDSWVRNVLLGSNFRVIADVDAIDPDQWDKLDAEAGLVIRKRPNRQFEYQPPAVDAAQGIPQALQVLIQLSEMLTGVGESTRSPAQGAAALEGLQMARQVLTRSVARRLESFMERIGQKLISRVFQFYTSSRILMQQGPNRDWITYTYERQKLLQDDKGNMRSVEERQSMYRDFRFVVTPGSSLATTRVQRTMAMLQMRTATGFAPSVRRVLQEADLGDADEIIREGLEEAKQLPQPPQPKGRSGRV